MNISQQLDNLSADLMGYSFDLLADGTDLGVQLSVADASGIVAAFSFQKDDTPACIAAAKHQLFDLVKSHGDKNQQLNDPIMYAFTYEGAIDTGDSNYQDALIMEFGEKGAVTAWSAYSLIANKGKGESFTWSDPLPAGEVDLLL